MLTTLGCAANRADDAIERGTGSHGSLSQRRIRAVITADIDCGTLRHIQLPDNLRLVCRKLPGYTGERFRKPAVCSLLGERLGPVKRQVKMAAAIIELANFARR